MKKTLTVGTLLLVVLVAGAFMYKRTERQTIAPLEAEKLRNPPARQPITIPGDPQRSKVYDALIGLNEADVIARLGQPLQRTKINAPGRQGENWEYEKVEGLNGSAILMIRNGKVRGIKNNGFSMSVDR